MAKKQIVEIVDDLDGSPADTTVKFGVDGRHYEIDLSEKNAKELRDFLKKYRDAGTPITGPAPKNEAKKIRQWAEENDYPVAKRGRLHSDIVEAYRNAKKR